MPHLPYPPATPLRRRIDSFFEMEHQLHSLRALVCDLLIANQRLRQALQHGQTPPPRPSTQPQP